MIKNSGKTPASLVIMVCMSMLWGCRTTEVIRPMRIALSSGSENYINWIHRGDSLVEIVDFKGMQHDSATKLLSTCDGIVFTGGEDVVPEYYGKGNEAMHCLTNPERDSLEFALIKEALKLKMPVLGICRGQQILNVALGGTLIVDIPLYHPGIVTHQCEDYLSCFHHVSIIKGSHMHTFTKADTGMVTTNHHQAIEKTAPGIRIVAWSTDSIAEAIEWENPEGKSFLLAVQWHPERMETKSTLSMPLMNAFLEATIAFRKIR